MSTNVDVPSLGESVSEAVLLRWLKNDGETVQTDEPVAELETDKANVELPAPAGGVLRHAKEPGETVMIGETIARIDPGGSGAAAPQAPAKGKAVGGASSEPAAVPPIKDTGKSADVPAPVSPQPRQQPARAEAEQPNRAGSRPEDLSPAVRRLVQENKLDPSSIPATGPSGRLTKEDVEKHLASRRGVTEEVDEADEDSNGDAPPHPTPARATAAEPPLPASKSAQAPSGFDASGVKRVPMSKIRKRIAENLVRAQQTAAILTTFNEVDLSNVMSIRAKYKERFNEVHGVGLGLMSFFARAAVLGLREFPRINAQIDGDDVLYHSHVHLGIAVSTDRGLAVPVLRHVESMSFAKIESEIKRLAAATRDGKLSLQELSGGTFTITNGGVYGSLLSTPIVNPPQSGILGMHTIQKRPVAVADRVEIRPMMYIALSYDHRIVDGKESVSFLVRLKEYLEDPARLMLEI